jgi:hypothetical protein
MLIFAEGGKPENPEKNPRGKGENQQINNKLNSHMTPNPGIEPEITVVRGERLAATPPIAIPLQCTCSYTYIYIYYFEPIPHGLARTTTFTSL